MTKLLKDFSEGNKKHYYLETGNGKYLGECLIKKYSDSYELWNVQIFEPFQRMGYGTFMLREIIKRYKRFIKSDMPLILYVYKDNEVAINLYKRFGFKIVGEYSKHAWEMRLTY